MAKRNYGIDLLRCLSMMMVVTLHVLGHGGVTKAVEIGTPHYWIAWLLEMAAFSAVNCYALISGYVGVNSSGRYRNAILLWLQVMFYSGGIAVLFRFFAPDLIDTTNFFRAVFPVLSARYWYFTMYVVVLCFAPLLNRGINALDERSAKWLVAALCVLFSGTYLAQKLGIPGADPFMLHDGYSALWLIVLYVIGGCIARFDLFASVSSGWLIVINVGCVIFSWLFKCVVEMYNVLGDAVPSYALTSYLSPTVLVAAITLLLLFARRPVLPKWLHKITVFLAPVSFSVYLIHEQRQVRDNFIVDRFAALVEQPPVLFTLCIIGSVLAIYLVCSLIDHGRLWLFRFLRIKPLVDALCDKMDKKKEG